MTFENSMKIGTHGEGKTPRRKRKFRNKKKQGKEKEEKTHRPSDPHSPNCLLPLGCPPPL
jgi:hypothetical protein